LTQNGREGIEHVLTSFKVDKSLWDEFICLAAGLLLGSLILFWFSMPLIADKHYIKLGDQAYGAGQWMVAENNYSRALKLNPKNTQIYYKLGELYQQLPDYYKAIENYKIAWKGNHLKAADEIASLYFKQHDYQQADEWLELALKPQRILVTKDKPYEISQEEFYTLTRSGVLNQQESDRKKLRYLDARKFAVIKDRATLNDKQFELLIGLADFYLKKEQYSDSDRRLYLGFALAKNDKKKQATIRAYQGWIQFKQERYSDAETHLRDAIFINNKLASAHCLLAQVSEKQNKQDEAKKSWEQCLQYASQYNENENKWISLAIQGLNSKGKVQ
jgi:tetratricopeptide (TPR) repeat protein